MVIELVLPEPDEAELELVESAPPEPDEPELEPLESALPEAEELVPGLVEPALVVVAALVLVLWASAGSWPDTSWTKMTPQTKAKVEAAVASARLRINATRRRRAPGRAATPPATSGRFRA